MLLKLLKYDIKLKYVPGKDLIIADTLSRAFQNETEPDDPEMEYHIHNLSNYVPMSDQNKTTFQRSIENDPVLQKVKEYVINGWPEFKKIEGEVKIFHKFKDEIFYEAGLLFISHKLIVPEELKISMINLIHEAHLGMKKCKRRARQIFYWPNMNHNIEQFIEKC